MCKEAKVRQETKEILEQALEKMKENYPEQMKSQLQAELFSGDFDKLITIQGQGENPVLGYFDLNLNQYATINMLSLIIILAEKLNQVFLQSPEYTEVSTGISVCIFILALLNTIQPRSSVELDMEDAQVYKAFLKLQRDSLVDTAITYEELEKYIKKTGEEINISRCLTHLEEKRLIKVVPNGFLVKTEVKVKPIL